MTFGVDRAGGSGPARADLGLDLRQQLAVPGGIGDVRVDGHAVIFPYRGPALGVSVPASGPNRDTGRENPGHGQTFVPGVRRRCADPAVR
jgi:hypothetical protein